MHTVPVLFIAVGWATVCISQQPTLIKIDFFVSKCMLSFWLGAQEPERLGVAEIIHISLTSLRCHLDTTTITILSRFLRPQRARGTGVGTQGRAEEDLKRGANRHQNNPLWIHTALHCSSFPPSRLRGTAAPEEPVSTGQVLLKSKHCERILNYFSLLCFEQ